MLRVVSVRGDNIEYTLTYKKVKNINLRVKADGSVCVSAPKYVNANRVDEFVASKGKFVLDAVEKFKNSQMMLETPKRYVSGESFKILGKDLRLKVLVDSVDEVYSDGVFIYLKVQVDEFVRKERLLNNWVKAQTVEVFRQIAWNVHKSFKKYGVLFPKIKIRKMKTKWGSCQPVRGVVTLNSVLIKAPRACIEYVVMHEFCHFIHPNHSKNFYTLLSVMMPDWKVRKDMLEGSYLF